MITNSSLIRFAERATALVFCVVGMAWLYAYGLRSPNWGLLPFSVFFVAVGGGVFLKKGAAIRIAKVLLIVFAFLFLLLTVPSHPDLRINGNHVLAVISCIGLAIVCVMLFLGLSTAKGSSSK